MPDDTYDILNSVSYYEDGEVIFAEGSSGDEMYVIHSGQVEISKMINNQKRVLAIRGKDSLFGEMALLCNTPRTATATAMGRATLLPFNEEAMEKRIESNPVFALNLIRSLSDRLMRTTLRMKELVAVMREYDDERIRSVLGEIPEIGL